MSRLIGELTLELGVFEVHGLAVDSSVKTAKNGKSFVRFNLIDGDDSIGCMRFDCDTAPANGDAIVCTGTTDEFNGTLQFRVTSWKASDRDPSEFVPASAFAHIDLRDCLRVAIEDIEAPYGPVVRTVFEDIWDEFLRCPASKTNHHAFERGLAEHTLSMVRLANAVADHYLEFYPNSLNRDLLVSGVFLHDLGKIVDFAKNGVVWEITVDGELVNHMTHAVLMVHDACMALATDPHVERELAHMILSHHGQLEWGSPVTPKLIEAQLLHFIDNMDARSAMFRAANAVPGEMTDWVRPLGGRVTRGMA